MARGGLSFAGIGAQFVTYKAGQGIKDLVANGNRDDVAGIPVVISDNQTVDLGSDGDTIFGFIDVYEMDGHCTVQFRGFRENVAISEEELHTATLNKVVAVNGAGGVKDSSTTTKLRTPIFTEVADGLATVFLG